MQITTKANAKTVVSALRRELKALHKNTDGLSHNDCLTALAKAMGFASWNAWEAALPEDVHAPAAAQPAPAPQEERKIVLPKYRLDNLQGKFDFVPEGENGIPFAGDFLHLAGTSEELLGRAEVTSAYRMPGTDYGLGREFEDTKIFWDTSETQSDSAGHSVWLSRGGLERSEAQVILVPEGVDDVYLDEDLPVREALVDAYIAYCREESIAQGAFGQDGHNKLKNVAEVLGFRLTKREEERFIALYVDR